jgi:HEAT repeats
MKTTIKTWLALLIFVNLFYTAGWAQTQQPASSTQAVHGTPSTDNDEEPDVPVAKPDKSALTTVKQQTTNAWNMLTTALANTDTKAEVMRIDAINALGTLGDFPLAQNSLRTAQKDQDRYVRLAAVAAMGTSKKTVFIPDLQQALKDEAPEVSFTAADPDPAARALGAYHGKEVTDALSDALYGNKPAVRFMAAAAYIRAAHPQTENKVVQRRGSATKSMH